MDLRSIVRMQGDDSPCIPSETRLQDSDHIDLCLRPYGSCLGPSGAPIRDRESSVEVSHRLSSIMTCQVHRQDTKDMQRRVHARLDGDPASKRSTAGMGGAMQDTSLPFSGKEPPDRGRTHLEEEPSGLLIDMEMSISDEVLHEESHPSHQTDWSQEGASCPDGDECLQDGRTIPGGDSVSGYAYCSI